MDLECPSCATRYLVDPATLGAGGRKMRCARCHHTWFEKAPTPSFDSLKIAEPPELPELPDPIKRRRSIPRGTNLSAVHKQSGAANWVGWALLVVVVGAIVAGGVFAREQIVAAWPPAVKFYELVRLPLEQPGPMFDFKNVSSTQEVENGVMVLSVTGEVFNRSEVAQRVPNLRVVLHDEAKRELVSWLVSMPSAPLGPGQSVAFSTRREKPPAEARGLKVSVERDD